MPIHIVPLVVGGTIAVIGTGYAFKKFVYDPHLAPIVEAFLATHGHETRRLNEPISIHATSHSRAPQAGRPAGVLRRRGQNPTEDREEREGLLLADLEDRRGSTESTTGATRDSIQAVRPSLPPKRPLPARSSSDRPRPQDAEIRSIIFNHPASPPPPTARSSAVGMMGAGGITLMPEILPPPQRTSPHPTGPSTTFSFLSLSQASSPEVPTSMLDSMMSVMRDARDEVVSLPDTTSGYDSAEPFSVVSSPHNGHTSLPTQTPSTVSNSGLGLNNVGDVGMSYISPVRTSRSVISLSESEGASDWEALSEARAGST